MTTIEMIEHVGESRELTIKFPDWIQFKPGQRLKITIEGIFEPTGDPEPVWTDEELTEMLISNPVPADEIATGGWEAMGITDSQSWVDEQRRKRAEERK